MGSFCYLLRQRLGIIVPKTLTSVHRDTDRNTIRFRAGLYQLLKVFALTFSLRNVEDDNLREFNHMRNYLVTVHSPPRLATLLMATAKRFLFISLP
ncbi:Uncharacterised protein [Segatella copri]|nr:Uncharacterised protein [Segatella copri]